MRKSNESDRAVTTVEEVAGLYNRSDMTVPIEKATPKTVTREPITATTATKASALIGVTYLGCTYAKNLGSTPSLAMAKYTLPAFDCIATESENAELKANKANIKPPATPI